MPASCPAWNRTPISRGCNADTLSSPSTFHIMSMYVDLPLLPVPSSIGQYPNLDERYMQSPIISARFSSMPTSPHAIRSNTWSTVSLCASGFQSCGMMLDIMSRSFHGRSFIVRTSRMPLLNATSAGSDCLTFGAFAWMYALVSLRFVIVQSSCMSIITSSNAPQPIL